MGDIVGSPGRKIFAQAIPELKEKGMVDFVVANAENAAGGRGLTPETAEELFKAGADIITLGDHTWDQKEIQKYLETEKRVVRPYNFPSGCPGKGYVTIESAWGPVNVVSLMGRVFMPPVADCPFRSADVLLKGNLLRGKITIVDFHAEATSEKIVLGRYLDGRISMFGGTHTHVQTSDEYVMPKGSGYITDLGMTGPKDSAIGRDLESITERFITGIPDPFKVAKNDVVLEGAVANIDRESGKAVSIERVRWRNHGK